MRRVGKTMKILVPTPSLLEKPREPLCNSVSDFAVLKPKPVPSKVCKVLLATRTNGIKTCAIWLFTMPMPLSEVEILYPSLGSKSAKMLIFPPEGENVTAFDNKSNNICLM